MKLLYTELNNVDRMNQLLKEHPGWTWMEWSDAWEQNRDEDYHMIAISLMMNGV